MRKQFEDFQKMKLKEACKRMEDMAYAYINPDTKKPTCVPAKHFENILNKTVEQFLDENLKIEMLNNVYKQVLFLKQEYGKDFIKSLICMDMGVKPSDMLLVQTIALEETYNYVIQSQETQKKDFHLLNQDFSDKFKEVINNQDIHIGYINGQIEPNTDIEEENDEPDICEDF